MRIYAKFIRENDLEYRKETILHFGESWNLIGSLILKNPGTAEIERKINEEEYIYLSDFNMKNHNVNTDQSNWFTTKGDSTIKLIPKIFNGWYISKNKDLDGVIQLFNLFYLKNKDVNFALNHMKSICSSYLMPDAKELCALFKDKPVYIGWGDLYKLDELKDCATELFEFVRTNNSAIYDETITNNNFCHPLGLMSHYQRPNNQKILKDFFEALN